MTTPRSEVYAALDSERAYQDERWAGYRGLDGVHVNAIDRTLDEFILYVEQYAWEARTLSVHGEEEEALEFIRKVGALCVGCMEKHGAPKREGF